MSSSVISVANLSKSYVISHRASSTDGLRHAVEAAIRNPIQWMADRKERQGKALEELWALRNISFEVNQGQVVGIIGRNGSGKSTLLKILSRITEPTSGRIRLKGRVASLLEVGTGFHPDLTGRENIFLNGSILGMARAEIIRKFDDIVAFSEVEKHLDTPVKRYSSGMYVRLAFAVAAHMESEILIVDEVLAVGDASFQKKCLGKMEDVAKGQGRTVLFVSHNMGTITRLCNHSILLENGALAMMGSTEEVVSRYFLNAGDMVAEKHWPDTQKQPGNGKMRLRTIRVTDRDGSSTGSVDIRQPFYVEIHYRILEPLPHVRVTLRLIMTDGTIVFSSADTGDLGWRDKARGIGQYVSRCEIPGNLLNEGLYVLTVAADIPFVEVLFWEESAISFQVEQAGGPGGLYPEKWPGIICPMLNWEIDRSDKFDNA